MLPSLTDIGGFAATRGCTPCAAYAAIPAHPQKRHTRLWRLYHFCGFCYPIREVIPIAIYHWNIGIVSRGKGKSAVAAAAYRSGEKLTNEWDGMTHDYTRKGGVVHTEIMLPPHAPPSFSDRSTLWNSVELYEKARNAQLAREIDAALPIELSREEQIRLVREYCSSQFVSRGMCVDYAIHDTDSGNPHCHIMLTMRPLDERGTWAAKSKKEYDLDENGERIRLPSGRYKTHKVDLTGWNDKDNTLLWRKAWADFTNDFLERNGSPERIDHRSNAERGIDEIPTVHMGVAACQMEKKRLEKLQKRIQREQIKYEPARNVSKTYNEIDRMGQKTITGKMAISKEDYSQLTALAKEGITSRAEIKKFEQSANFYRQKYMESANALERMKTKYNELKEKCRPFLEALEHFPEVAKLFTEKVKQLFSFKEAQERAEKEAREKERQERIKARKSKRDMER